MTHKEARTILSPENGLPRNAANSLAVCRRIACLCAAALFLNESGAQEIMVLPFAPAPTPQPEASASAKPAPPPKLNRQRYDVRQTFDGSSYEKDNNVWVYDRDFAELFGMPEKYIEPIVGAVAAAYRIEDLGYQLCGLGGVDKNCMPTEVCRLDLYFDEAKTPLPWATELRQQWVPEHSSLWWLKPQDPRDRPGSMIAIETPPGILRGGSYSRLIAFADPATNREAKFTTNAGFADVNKIDPSSPSGVASLMGYSRSFYRTLSVVSLHYDCHIIKRHTVTIRLDARIDSLSKPIASFNQVTLPEGFVKRTNELAALRVQRSTDAVRKALGPLGTLLGPATEKTVTSPSDGSP